MSALLLAGTVATATATAIAGVIGIGHPGQPETGPTHKPATSITQPVATPHGDTHMPMSPADMGSMMGKGAMTGMPMSPSDMGSMMGKGAMTGMPMMGSMAGS